MDKHVDDLESFEKRIKKTQTSLTFVILFWVISFAMGLGVFYTLNFPIVVTFIFGLSFILIHVVSVMITLRYFHLEPLAREIVYLNKEITLLKNKNGNN